jgi:SAM-dependent methyltransferase
MRNPDRWSPSKYVLRTGQLRGTRNRAELGVGSRLIADLVAERYEQYLPRFAKGRLVDLGCGKVPLFGSYKKLVSEVTCVDWPQSVHPGEHVDVEVDLGGQLPFTDSCFDTIVLSDVLEHVPSPERLWHEMARVLAPGGHALINVPFMYGLHEVPHDYARYSAFALRRFAQQAGLQVSVLEAVGGSLHVMADLLAKHFAKIQIIGPMLALAVQGMVRALDATAIGRRLADRTGEHFPLGYFVVASRGPAEPVT